MSGGPEPGEPLAGFGVVLSFGVDADEEAVGAVVRGNAERLSVHGQDSRALFSGALGDELLDPEPEAIDRAADRERQLVPPFHLERRHRRAEERSRVSGRVAPAELRHAPRARQQLPDVDPEERGGHEAEV
jgi:hypothetical protein